MPFNLFDGLDTLINVLSMDFSSKFSNATTVKNKNSKITKYTTEILSGSFLAIASILFFMMFKSPSSEQNFTAAVMICSVIGLLISFVIFFALYQLGLFYFKSLFKLLLFSCSMVLQLISAALVIYVKIIF